MFDPLGLAVLLGATALRLTTSAIIMQRLGDREGLRNLPWMPLRDLAGLLSWFATLGRRTVSWRGAEYRLLSDGRMVPRGR